MLGIKDGTTFTMILKYTDIAIIQFLPNKDQNVCKSVSALCLIDWMNVVVCFCTLFFPLQVNTWNGVCGWQKETVFNKKFLSCFVGAIILRSLHYGHCIYLTAECNFLILIWIKCDFQFLIESHGSLLKHLHYLWFSGIRDYEVSKPQNECVYAFLMNTWPCLHWFMCSFFP